MIVTITSSFDPILKRAQIRPGTHIACMGTDTKGKQEVEAELVAAATVFTDEVAQSTSIGEAQHAAARGLISADAITPDRPRSSTAIIPAAVRPRKSPFSTAPASACRISPSRARSLNSPAPPVRRRRSTSSRRRFGHDPETAEPRRNLTRPTQVSLSTD